MKITMNVDYNQASNMIKEYYEKEFPSYEIDAKCYPKKVTGYCSTWDDDYSYTYYSVESTVTVKKKMCDSSGTIVNMVLSSEDTFKIIKEELSELVDKQNIQISGIYTYKSNIEISTEPKRNGKNLELKRSNDKKC